jgi:hypothetical protein
MHDRRLEAAARSCVKAVDTHACTGQLALAVGTDVGMLLGMTNQTSSDLEASELANVTAGAGVKASWNSIKQQATPYCPTTVAKYGSLDPAAITRSKAQKMGSECIAELGPLMGSFARGTIDGAIDQAFPPR